MILQTCSKLKLLSVLFKESLILHCVINLFYLNFIRLQPSNKYVFHCVSKVLNHFAAKATTLTRTKPLGHRTGIQEELVPEKARTRRRQGIKGADNLGLH